MLLRMHVVFVQFGIYGKKLKHLKLKKNDPVVPIRHRDDGNRKNKKKMKKDAVKGKDFAASPVFL